MIPIGNHHKGIIMLRFIGAVTGLVLFMVACGGGGGGGGSNGQIGLSGSGRSGTAASGLLATAKTPVLAGDELPGRVLHRAKPRNDTGPHNLSVHMK